VALSNTTLGALLASINTSIMPIALPDVFRGIGIDPIKRGNGSLLLWLIMGYLMVTAVLVVNFRRLGDVVGRVRIYNLGWRLPDRRPDLAAARREVRLWRIARCCRPVRRGHRGRLGLARIPAGTIAGFTRIV